MLSEGQDRPRQSSTPCHPRACGPGPLPTHQPAFPCIQRGPAAPRSLAPSFSRTPYHDPWRQDIGPWEPRYGRVSRGGVPGPTLLRLWEQPMSAKYLCRAALLFATLAAALSPARAEAPPASGEITAALRTFVEGGTL